MAPDAPQPGGRQAGADVLAKRFGLSDEELLTILGVSPLELVGGQTAHLPQLGLLLALSEAPAAALTPGALARWVRTNGRYGRPIDLLLAHDFGGFEDALEDLSERGFVLGGRRG